MFFNCDNKYSKGHKCGENKLYHIDCEEEEPSQAKEIEEITRTISCHALDGIITPQNLKIKRYINNKRVTVFFDSRSTHNFIPYKEAKNINCFVYPTP